MAVNFCSAPLTSTKTAVYENFSYKIFVYYNIFKCLRSYPRDRSSRQIYFPLLILYIEFLKKFFAVFAD